MSGGHSRVSMPTRSGLAMRPTVLLRASSAVRSAARRPQWHDPGVHPARRNAPRVLGIVLAGGEGKRLSPLTADRAKPAVPFGGIYRLVDFVLSNLVNGGYRQIVVLT